MTSGWFAIGIINGKYDVNIGTLLRSARIFGAKLVFTIGKRYTRQCTDTINATNHIPLFHYNTFDEFNKAIPVNCTLVAIELLEESKPLETFFHPKNAIYLLGSENDGIPQDILDKIYHKIKLPGKYSLNVATAGSIVMYDRILKTKMG